MSMFGETRMEIIIGEFLYHVMYVEVYYFMMIGIDDL